MFKEHVRDHLWSIERPFKVKGMTFTTRMTILRLKSGQLFLHSPVSLTPQIEGRLEVLGEVQYLVTPNLEHHLFLEDYQKNFPRALTYAAPGLQEKRPDLHFAGVLKNVPEPGWTGELQQMIFEGAPQFPEVLFFEPQTRSLIVGDFCFNIAAKKLSLGMQAICRILGIDGRVAPGPRIKWAIKDKDAARKSLAKLLLWDFDRVIMAHGEPLESGGKEKIAQAYSFLLTNE